MCENQNRKKIIANDHMIAMQFMFYYSIDFQLTVNKLK